MLKAKRYPHVIKSYVTFKFKQKVTVKKGTLNRASVIIYEANYVFVTKISIKGLKEKKLEINDFCVDLSRPFRIKKDNNVDLQGKLRDRVCGKYKTEGNKP